MRFPRLILAAVAAICVIASTGYVARQKIVEQENAVRVQCQGYLRALHGVVRLHCDEHKGTFPPNLKALEETYGGTLDSVLKFQGHPRRGSGDRIDFEYVDWSTQPRGDDWSSGKYPLIYDCCLANHGGTGINIVMVDGSMQWDEGAAWLKKFAASHPNAKIVVPK